MIRKIFFKRNILFPSLFFLGSLLLSFLSSYIFTFSKDYKLDKIAYSINDYNSHIKTTDFITPTVTIDKKDQSNVISKYYPDLYATYYYGFLTDYIFQCSTTYLTDSFNNEIRFHTQQTFSINPSKTSDNFYAVDGNLYRTYYHEEVLPNRAYLLSRNNCDTFVFISDKYADCLLNKYNLNSYEDLIKDEVASVLTFTGIDGNTYRASINNVVTSTYKNGVLASEDNPFFGLIYVNGSILNSMNTQFEIGFKSSPYCIKDILKTIEKFGYNYEDFNISFKTVDYENKVLKENAEISEDFKSYLSSSNGSAYCYAIAITFAVLLCGVFYCLYSFYPKEATIVFCLLFFVFLIFNIVLSFTYSYYGYLLLPTIYISFSIIFVMKKWIDKINNSGRVVRGKIYYEIDI